MDEKSLQFLESFRTSELQSFGDSELRNFRTQVFWYSSTQVSQVLRDSSTQLQMPNNPDSPPFYNLVQSPLVLRNGGHFYWRFGDLELQISRILKFKVTEVPKLRRSEVQVTTVLNHQDSE